MGPVSNSMKIFTIDGNELNTDDMQMAYLSGNMQVKSDGEVILAASDNAWDKGKASSGGKNSSTKDVRSDEPFFPSYVNTQSAEDRNGLNLSADGYTNLEMYLHELAGDTMDYVDDKEVTVSFDDKYYEGVQIVVPSVEPTPTPVASPEVSATPSVSPSATPSKTPSPSPMVSEAPSQAPSTSPVVSTVPSATASSNPSASPEVSVEPSVTTSPEPGPGPTGEPPIAEPEIMLGDVDNNKNVNLTDAQMALKVALKIINKWD